MGATPAHCGQQAQSNGHFEAGSVRNLKEFL